MLFHIKPDAFWLTVVDCQLALFCPNGALDYCSCFKTASIVSSPAQTTKHTQVNQGLQSPEYSPPAFGDLLASLLPFILAHLYRSLHNS